jgi:DNA gyrase subunit B
MRTWMDRIFGPCCLLFSIAKCPIWWTKGYLYIAQPPLFKIGKGKSESYMKDERELK